MSLAISSPEFGPSVPDMKGQEDRVGFHLAEGLAYMLDRGYGAASRLNLQFYLWKESLKFNLHPSIPIPSEDVKIADVATGTAIWLLDLAKELPGAHLDGLDIDITQAPAQPWLPPNVTLKQWNIFEQVPDDLLEKYDVVHLRLLILVVENSDPVPIIRNVSKMLKPGGYIQWDDLDYPGTHVKTVGKSAPCRAFQELRTFVYSKGKNDWVLNLPQMLENHGFTDAQRFHFEDRPELSKANSDQHLLTMEEFALRLAKENKQEEARKVRHLISAVSREAGTGTALSMPRIVCVARKL